MEKEKINNYVWENDLSLNDLVLKQKEEIERLKEEFEKEKYLVDKYTRQLTDEYKNTEYQCKEKERLNNIINELEKILEYEKNDYGGNIDIETHNIDSEFLRGNSWEADYILNKLQELKGDDSNENK